MNCGICEKNFRERPRAMAKGPKGENRHAAPIARAVKIGRMAVGDETKATPESEGKDAAAVSMGKRGGKARAAKLTPAKRAEIARKAAAKRWGKRP